MKNLIIKIGKMDWELNEVYRNPETAVPGSHTLFLESNAELSEILSPKRIELISYLLRHGSEKKPVSLIAEELKRKQEAISRDAGILEKYALIRKVKEKQVVYLKALYGSLKIELAGN